MTDQTPGPDGRTSYGNVPSAPPAGAAGYGAPGPDAAAGKKTLGLVGLVLGIVGLLLAFLIPILGLPLGVAGLVLGILSRKREPLARGLALGGIITGIIAIVVSIANWILAAVLVAQAMNS